MRKPVIQWYDPTVNRPKEREEALILCWQKTQIVHGFFDKGQWHEMGKSNLFPTEGTLWSKMPAIPRKRRK